MSWQRRRGIPRVDRDVVERIARSRAARAAGVTLVTFLLGYMVAAAWLSPAGDDPTDTRLVTVPDLVGSTLEEATELLADRGLERVIGARLHHPDAPEGRVLAQDPLPDQLSRPEGTVELTLSAGPASRRVPELGGLAASQAAELLRRLGFEVEVRREESGGQAGVLGTRPEAGTLLTLPASVELRVAEGAPIVEVPDLRGRHVEDVEAALRGAGLQLGALRYRPDAPQAPGRVTSQSPPAGVSVRTGTFVSVVVAGDPPDEGADIARDEPPGDARPDSTAPGDARPDSTAPGDARPDSTASGDAPLDSTASGDAPLDSTPPPERRR